MASETKWMAVIVEVDTYDGEVQSILPVDAETADFFSKEELDAIVKFLKQDDDADFDFMWEFRTLMANAAGSGEHPSKLL